MPQGFFDSHCHLTDERFSEDREEVVERAREARVRGMVSIASDAGDSESVARLVEGRSGLWGTAGIHPHVAADAESGDLDRIVELLGSRSRLVAVGETGLDYHYDNSPRPTQRKLFREQVEIAVDLELPVVVHTREAEEDTVALIRDVGSEVRGVLHCFTGSTALLEEGLAAGWYVSFSGIASFASFRSEDDVRLVPRDRLLIETDAPYLAPDPKRGRRNEPAFVVHVADAVARMRGEDRDEVGAYTSANARAFYGLKPVEGAGGGNDEEEPGPS